jgi:hypothetical protein
MTIVCETQHAKTPENSGGGIQLTLSQTPELLLQHNAGLLHCCSTQRAKPSDPPARGPLIAWTRERPWTEGLGGRAAWYSAYW